MGERRSANLQFPMGGQDQAQAYQTQPPYTTPDSQNVRPIGTLEGRARGGSRPGLDFAHYDTLGTGNPVRMMAQVTYSGTDGFEYFTDDFDTDTIGAQWSAATHLNPATLPLSYEARYASADPTDATGAVLRALTSFDNTKDYKIELYIVPYLADHHGKYQIYCRMDNTTPILTTDGVVAELTLEAATGAYSVTLKSYVGGNETVNGTYSSTTSILAPGIFALTISGNNATITWREKATITNQAVTTPCAGVKGDRLGFGINCTQNDAAGSKALVDWFRVQYYVTGSPTKLHTKALMVANGIPYQELWMGKLTAVATLGGITLPTAKLTLAAERGGILYIADPTAVRTYTPGTDTLATLVVDSGKGTVPTGCPLIQRFRDRIVVAGAEASPQIWYMSRQGAPGDWLYTDTDEGAACAATSSPAGKIGQPTLALAAWLDSYLIFGCTNSLWALRGDPAAGGRLFNLSEDIGVLDKAAWCFGPNGEFIFLSRDGLYALPPEVSGRPQSISREKLPRELLNVDRNIYTVLMAYDSAERGVHIYLTAEDQRKGLHWWMQWPEGTFWPVSIPNAQEPTAILQLRAHDPSQTAVLLGGRNGLVKRYRANSETDAGTEITSYVLFGPMRLGGDEQYDGIWAELQGTLGSESGQVTWGIYPGDTAEQAVKAGARVTGTWSGGLNAISHPRVRGSYAALRLENADADRAWTYEGGSATFMRGGKRRIG